MLIWNIYIDDQICQSILSNGYFSVIFLSIFGLNLHTYDYIEPKGHDSDIYRNGVCILNELFKLTSLGSLSYSLEMLNSVSWE